MVTLLVAAIGGHLTELHQLRPRLPVDDVVWITNDSPQSRSVLAGETVEFVPYVAPRDAVTAARLFRRARRACGGDVEQVISTGSAVAVPYLVAAAACGRRAVYIESATRLDGPSLTGRILRAVPSVELFTQNELWAGGRWAYSGSVFEGYEAVPHPSPGIERIVVSLGTMRRYPFRSVVERLVEIIPSGVEVLWQTGDTPVGDLGIEAYDVVPSDRLHTAMQAADVVIAHAGIGSALAAMNCHKCPVLVPRRKHRGEHVDDHQAQIVQPLSDAELAVFVEADALTWEHLERAASRRVERRAAAPLIGLDHPYSSRGAWARPA